MFWVVGGAFGQKRVVMCWVGCLLLFIVLQFLLCLIFAKFGSSLCFMR